MYEMFVYKHTEITEHAKKYPSFYEKYKFRGYITREFIGLRMQNFQGIVLVWTRTYGEILKSVLVYL